MALETVHHLYFECSFSSYIWQLCKLKLGINDGHMGDLIGEATKIKDKFRKKRKITILASATLRATIWRNERVFQHKARHRIVVFKSIYEDIKELMKTCHWKSSRVSHSLCILSNWDVNPYV